MDNLTLVINPGSSSIKFGLFTIADDGASLETLLRGSLQGIGTAPSFNLDAHIHPNIDENAIAAAQKLHFSTIEQAHKALAGWLSRLFTVSQIVRVCYRIVHGGGVYHKPEELNKAVVKKLESFIPFAPLHQPMGLNAFKVFRKHYPEATHIACFDTAFHQTMPKVAQTFAIPDYLSEQGVKPYGFHGLSYHYIVSTLRGLNKNRIPKRVVIAHLGSGASMCALLNGDSIATSMTFSPLDGLPMATRCGAIDAGALLYMIQTLGLPADEVSNLLNKQSGLLGLSGISGDIRKLLESNANEAVFALDFYINRICRELGAFTGLLQGLDALVFTGGVGAHSWQIREKVCDYYQWLGVLLDQSANRRNECLLSTPASKINVYAMKTDEEMMMAKLVMIG